MSSNPDMVSGEGVAYDLLRADVGSRTVAALLDFIGQAIVFLIVLLIDINAAGSSDAAAITAAVLTEYVVIFGGYPIVSEWVSQGRTLGKLAMGLRVLRDDGGPIGFRQALVRGLSGLVLEKPGLFAPVSTAIGFLSMTFSSRAKRVGDMMAGTFVVNERAGQRRASAPPPMWYVAPPLQPWAVAADLTRVDDSLALSIRQFLTRAHQLRPEAQYGLGEGLRAQLLLRVTPPPPQDAPTPWLLMAVLGERRRRADLAAQHAGYGVSLQASPPSSPPSNAAAAPIPSPTGEGFVPPS